MIWAIGSKRFVKFSLEEDKRMSEVIRFETARPVIRRRKEELHRSLIRRYWSFYLRGDSYMADADRVATAHGFAFNCYHMPKNAPDEVHALMAKARRYDQQANRFYRRAEALAAELWPARHVKVDPRGVA